MAKGTNEAPLTVYGRGGQPGSVALVIARTLPGSELRRTRERYKVSVASIRPLFRQVHPELLVDIDPEFFHGAGGEQERAAVRDQIVRTMRGPGLDDVLEMVPDLGMAVFFVPSDDSPAISLGHPLFGLALDVASRIDGFVLDRCHGRILSMTGELLASSELYLADSSPVDPSVTRIRGRLVALAAVALRALTEFDGRDVDEARYGIDLWVRSIGMSDELEPDEEELLRCPPGALPAEDLATRSWQIEGATVLAWALDLLDELPPFDEPMDPTVLGAVVRFLDADQARSVLHAARRRHHALIESEAARHYSIYWRLSEFAATQEALDLEALIGSGQSGPSRFEGVPLVDGDLSVRGLTISKADPEAIEVAVGITTERLCALNWLRRGGLYSATDLDL